MRKKPQILVFSGLDPSGGAGIQADIQAISALGGHPLPVLSCLTVQDTVNVYEAQPVQADLIRRQLDCLAGDVRIDAIKTGALGNADLVDVLLGFIDRAGLEVPLVVDPVLAAAGGGELAGKELVLTLQRDLIGRADVITPNAMELQTLGAAGEPDTAAKQLLEQGCRAILATGGHGKEAEILNRLYQPDQPPREWRLRRRGGEYHGSGCTLAAALAAGLASGMSLERAIEQAQDYVAGSIAGALQVGRGQPVPDRAWQERP